MRRCRDCGVELVNVGTGHLLMVVAPHNGGTVGNFVGHGALIWIGNRMVRRNQNRKIMQNLFLTPIVV